MEDSGKREQFGSGAVRDTAEGKPKMHFLAPFVWQNIIPDTDPLSEVGTWVSAFLRLGNTCYLESAFDVVMGEIGYDRLCNWLEEGAKKYDSFNWAKGMPVSRCLCSLGRHMLDYMASDDKEDHCAAMACNLMFIIHFIRNKPELNDMPVYDKLLQENKNDIPSKSV